MPNPKVAKEKLYDVMLTRTIVVVEDGERVTRGPKERGGEAVKLSVKRRLGNQIVSANRGYWADGPPADHNPRVESETPDESGPSAKSKKTRGPSGV